MPGLKGKADSSPHLREVPGLLQWVRNFCMQKPLKMLTEIETGVPANVLGREALRDEWKGQ